MRFRHCFFMYQYSNRTSPQIPTFISCHFKSTNLYNRGKSFGASFVHSFSAYFYAFKSHYYDVSIVI